jgi:signal transduction histidine kinase
MMMIHAPQEAHEPSWLAQVHGSMLASLDDRVVVDGVARLVVPRLAAGCAIDLVRDQGHSERAALTADGDASRAALDSDDPDDDAYTMLTLPICADGICYGAMSLVRPADAPLTREQLSTAIEVAGCTGAAIRNCRAYDNVARALRSRDHMLSMVSHDLRNLLMLTNLRLTPLMREARGGALQRPLESLRRGVQLMERIVSDLVDLSSIEAGRLSISLELHELRQLLEEAVDGAGPDVSAKGIALALGDVQCCRVRCDRVRLLQALANLLGNAVKFTDTPGRISVHSRLESEKVLVVIHDTGCGIDAALLPLLFTPYAQAQKTARQGRGLGLFIAKRLVEAHGGALTVASEPNVGTTFTISLPVVDAVST